MSDLIVLELPEALEGQNLSAILSQVGVPNAKATRITTSGGVGLTSIQTEPIATIDGDLVIWSGGTGGQGNLFVTAMFVGQQVGPLTFGRYMVSNSQPGGISGVGIYDQNGDLVAHGGNTTALLPSGSIAGAALNVQPTLNAGELYYAAVYCNANAMTFGRSPSFGTLPGSLSMAFVVPNSGGLPGAVAGFPPNILAYSGNKVNERVWAAFQ